MSVYSLPTLLNSTRWSGMRVGLLGGSFNPPHEGHVHIARVALESLKLDAVWWLVTPQNPLKDRSNLLPMEERIRQSRAIMQHPKILVTDIEKELGTPYTYKSVHLIKKRFPKTDFVWISGLDNALTFHRWNEWPRLLNDICTVFVTRQPVISLIQRCPLRLLSSHRQIILSHGGRVPLDSGTTYWLLQKKMVNISSTQIREKTK